MHCANENQLVKMVWVEGSKSKAARKCRQVKCILLTSLFIDEFPSWIVEFDARCRNISMPNIAFISPDMLAQFVVELSSASCVSVLTPNWGIQVKFCFAIL